MQSTGAMCLDHPPEDVISAVMTSPRVAARIVRGHRELAGDLARPVSGDPTRFLLEQL